MIGAGPGAGDADFRGLDRTELKAALTDLRALLGASRVMLREASAGDEFPITIEILEPGVGPAMGLRGLRADNSPTFQTIAATGTRVVQPDCARAVAREHGADGPFAEMVATYGGLGAFIVEPIFSSGALTALISIHQLGGPREWTTAEVNAVAAVAERLAPIVGAEPC